MLLRYKCKTSLINHILKEDIISLDVQGMNKVIKIERDGELIENQISEELHTQLIELLNKTELFELIDEKVFSISDLEKFLDWYKNDIQFGEEEMKEALIYFFEEEMSSYTDFEEVKMTNSEIVVFNKEQEVVEVESVEVVVNKKPLLRNCSECKKKTTQEEIKDDEITIYRCESCNNFFTESGNLL